jgi:MFS family permease
VVVFLIAAVGVYLHQLWLLYLGYGVIGGIGLGLGYVSPVSTMIRWFPDHRGMATGMAIMGFGGGGMIGAPLGVWLMHHFHSATSVGVMQAFIAMGIIYFIVMSFGAFGIRLPNPNWRPKNMVEDTKPHPMITKNNVQIDEAVKTPQFWLLWIILCFNVTAGIGVLGQASVMIQEIFQGRVSVVAAASFVSLLSLANMLGRFFWSSVSDFIGRKATYFIFFALGAVLYILIPYFGEHGSILLFVVGYVVIISMYGGGFATIPAYLADMFGTYQVGGIHGRLLTAWSVAGVLGPVLINYLRQYQINIGIPKADAYNFTMYIMAGFLIIGFIANWLNRPVDPKYYMK